LKSHFAGLCGGRTFRLLIDKMKQGITARTGYPCFFKTCRWRSNGSLALPELLQLALQLLHLLSKLIVLLLQTVSLTIAGGQLRLQAAFCTIAGGQL
jgi:hypothetical protein